MKILIKSDDFGGQNYSLNSYWKKYIDIIVANNTKASLGVIGKDFIKISIEQIKELKELHDKKFIEFFNHSFNHIETGEKVNPYEREFFGTPMTYQIKSFMDCQNIILDKFGYTMQCFGAPHNSIDDTGVILLNNCSDIKYVYLYQNSVRFDYLVGSLKNKVLICLNGYGYLEKKEGEQQVIYKRFVHRFEELRKYELVTFQVHPQSWNDLDRSEFDKILKYLNSLKCTFILPSEL